MDKNNLNIKDFEEICRLCLQKKTTLHLIFKTGTFPRNHNIFLSIQQLIDPEISESDNLPRNVCDSCFQTLYRFEEFRNRCLKSVANLRSLITMKFVDIIIKEEIEDIKERLPIFGSEEEKLNIKEERTVKNRPSIRRSCKVLSKPIILDEEKHDSVANISNRRICLDTIKSKRKKCQAVRLAARNESPEDPDYDDTEKSTTVKKKQRGEKQMCPICGILVYSMKNHMQVHNNLKQFPCDMCDKTFNLRGNLVKHKKAIHSTVRSYPCTYCSMRFKTNHGLSRHTLIHTGERKYKCTLCDKSFYSSDNIKNHVLTHTQERNYECKFCHSKFLTSQRLLHHMPKHTGEKPYQCGICTMRFCYSSLCTQHRRIHMKNNAYVCTFCSLEFHDMRMFRIHHVDVHKVQLPLTSKSEDSTDSTENVKEFQSDNSRRKKCIV